MKFPPWIERAGLGLLATAALHGALWLLLGGTSAGRQSAVPPDARVFQVRLLNEPAAVGSQLLAQAQAAFLLGPRLALPPPAWAEWPDAETGAALAAPAPATSTQPAPTAPDRPALAVSAPDLSRLSTLPNSGAEIRLRLHIDATGVVRQVDVLACEAEDAVFVQHLVQILLATPHVPARRGGADVASVKEIQLAPSFDREG